MKVFPVVHIRQPELAIKQAQLALELGADGVYLIDHSADTVALFDTFNGVSQDNPKAYIGVNLLGFRPLAACNIIEKEFQNGKLRRIPDGLWADNALDENSHGETKIYKQNTEDLRGMRYLGGVAFKYTPDFTDDPERAYQKVVQARDRVDIVITSGEKTGIAPSVAKIKSMKQAVGATGTLAVASGISLENLGEYAGIVDEVLVASSVETIPYSGIFHKAGLQAFITKAHDI